MLKIFLSDTLRANAHSSAEVDYAQVAQFHATLAGYAPTPLRRLSGLARQLGLKDIYVKDEALRWGMNAFKILGASYAIHRLREREQKESYHFVTATDGNHGRAVAQVAHNLGQQATIFMPCGAEERRVKAIEALGARVIITNTNYDGAVAEAAAFARQVGGYLVQDTLYPGCDEVARDIVLGYSTMAAEAVAQIGAAPTHVFLQAGVGSMAGGVVKYLRQSLGDKMPCVGIIEACGSACIYASAIEGESVSIPGLVDTVMAGLNCGTPNPLILPDLFANARCYIAAGDELALRGMELAAHPALGDVAFSGGESGAVGLGVLEKLMTESVYAREKEQMGLNAAATVLLFNTEGRGDNLLAK